MASGGERDEYDEVERDRLILSVATWSVVLSVPL
jgi:hypothetical protein